jgi:signal transduction histidine kinase/CheY-like chemotaxis protein
MQSPVSTDRRLTKQLPLQLVLIGPFVAQTFAAVSIVGYLSFKNGQDSVNRVASQVRNGVSERIEQKLDNYLITAKKVSQSTADIVNKNVVKADNLEQITQLFWSQIASQEIGFLLFGGINGDLVGTGYHFDEVFPPDTGLVSPRLNGNSDLKMYNLDSNGKRTKLVSTTKDYAFQLEGWYAKTIKSQKTSWSSVYQWEMTPYPLSVSISHPIFNAQGQIIGAIAAEQKLSQISQFLNNLKVGKSGQVFIMERNGLLIGDSSSTEPFKVVDGKPQRLQASDSSNPLIQATAKHLNRTYKTLNEIAQTQDLSFEINGDRHFIQVKPWKDEQGLDWLVVVAVPESDFMAQINANTNTTIWLCLGALVGAILLGLYTSRWITLPILRLRKASEAITAGSLDQTVTVNGIDELAALAQSFNRMAGQLKTSFMELESRVEERTADLKQAIVRADDANQAKSEFLANMSHELRTPLNGILGYAQILQRSESLSDRASKGVSVIHQCGSHLLTLINDVLDLSKIEARKMELQGSDFHFPSFLEGIAEICRIRADQKGIEFIYEPTALPMGINADEKRLRQVLINLLGNAIKFTDKGSVTFLVETTPTEKSGMFTARFSIKDTGVGMAADQLDKIFLPFEQVGSTKKQSEGTGLGLSISQKIIELMDSRLEVQSELGRGSIFGFEVALTEAAEWAMASRKNSQGTVEGYAGEKRKILIVDDRWENRAVIVNLLEPIGFEMIEAADGKEGLVQLAAAPDLVITDLAMPVMDGFEMLKALRQTHPTLPVIVSSASVFELDQEKSIKAGGNSFLPKPVQAETLLEQIQGQLGLEWVYQAETPAAVKPIGAIVPPSIEILKQFAQLVDEGDFFALQEQAHALPAQYIVFTEMVIQLAEGFQAKKLTTLLQQHLEAVA